MNDYAKAFGADMGNILMEAMESDFRRGFEKLSPEEHVEDHTEDHKTAFPDGENVPRQHLWNKLAGLPKRGFLVHRNDR